MSHSAPQLHRRAYRSKRGVLCWRNIQHTQALQGRCALELPMLSNCTPAHAHIRSPICKAPATAQAVECTMRKQKVIFHGKQIKGLHIRLRLPLLMCTSPAATKRKEHLRWG